MQPQSHYALLVAINHYPGLSDLAGPENDAAALATWLTGTRGLDPNHVKVIKSSDYAKVKDPYDANPTDTHIKQALNGWLKDAEGHWLEHVGERLYLFFAGHGFTTGSLSDPALFTAQAQLDDRTHVAALRYAMKIANAGFFDEIVLVMDCCQDVLKSSSVIEPSWSPPDRSASHRVKVMTAFGAPRGRKAFEDAPPIGTTPATPVRGYFSRVFLEALEGTPADTQGRVMARAVEDHFVALWSPYEKRFGYVPPIDAPRDLVLYVRPVLPTDLLEQFPPIDAPGPSPADLARGITIELEDPAMQVKVLDTDDRIVARTTQTAQLRLPPGRYRAQIKLGRTLHETPFQLNPDGSVLEGPGLVAGVTSSGPGLPFWERTFASPVPAPWSSTSHEYHFGPCDQLLERARVAARAFGPGHRHMPGMLFLFARDSAHDPAFLWRMNEKQRGAVRLRHVGTEGVEAPLDLDIAVNDIEGWCSFTRPVASGTWLLGVRRRLQGRWIWDDVVIEVAPGMRTEVYLDCIDDAEDGRRYDADDVAISVVPWDSGSAISGAALRHTELLRAALEQMDLSGGLADTLPETDPDVVGPIGALYAAVLATIDREPYPRRVRTLTAWLREHWTAHSADVELLKVWCDLHERNPNIALDMRALPDDAVPMIDRCWPLLSMGGKVTRLAPGMQYAVALWRASGGVLVQTQTPDAIRRREPTPRSPVPLWRHDVYELLHLSDSLQRPNADASPLHQALRQVILGARDGDDLTGLLGTIDEMAHQAGIDEHTLSVVLNDLQDRQSAEDGSTQVEYLT